MIAKMVDDGLSFLNTLFDHVVRSAGGGPPRCPECGEEMVITDADVIGDRWVEVYACPACGTHTTASGHVPWDLFG